MSRLVSWYSSDPLFAWFTLLQVISYLILGVTVAIGYRLSINQSVTNQKLEADLVAAKTKLAESELQLEELRTHQSPRALARAEFKAALKGKPTGEAAVLYDELAGIEGYNLASDIVSELQEAGWKISDFGPITKVADSRIGVPAITQAGSYTGSGITIGVGILDFKKRPFTHETPYSTLWNALVASRLKFDACIPADPLPLNSFRILVGKRPPLECQPQ